MVPPNCFRTIILVMMFFVYLPARLAPADDAATSQLADLRTVKQRIIAELTLSDLPAGNLSRGEEIDWLDHHVDRLLVHKDGYWSEYTSVNQPAIQYNGAAWVSPQMLARAYATSGSTHHHSPAVLEAIEAGLAHLNQFAYPDCPQPGNWWAWQIGIPLRLLPTLTLLEGTLDADLFQRNVDTVVYLLKAHKEIALSGSYVPATQPAFGKNDTNALWHKQLVLALAVLLENPAMTGKWAHRTFGEIGPPGTGHLQNDYSFQFHGPIPMWAYGCNFIHDYALLARKYHGTCFAPAREQLDLLADMTQHYVNGFFYRGRICPAMIGRTVIRGPQEHHVTYGYPGLKALSVLAGLNAEYYEHFAPLAARESTWYADEDNRTDRVSSTLLSPPVAPIGNEQESNANATDGRPHAGTSDRPEPPQTRTSAVAPAPPIDDIFAYPDSDFMQVTRPDWAVGIKMHSARTRGFESINGENLQGWFLSHGSMFHFITGSEWDGCWPTLDWTRLPGTTVAAEIKGQNQSPFVGVLRASSRLALAAMELHVDAFKARKSWLVDDDAIICLGSGIEGPGRVETTLFNQPVPANATLLIDGQPAPAGPFSRTIRPRWLWLQNIGYVLPEGQEVQILRETRTSDWTSVREVHRHGAGETVTHTYLTAVIAHTPAIPGYAWLCLPNVPAEEMPTKATETLARYKIGRSASHYVATSENGFESIVLWEAGGAGDISADRGCLLLRANDHWHVADPTFGNDPLTINITGKAHKLSPDRGRARIVE